MKTAIPLLCVVLGAAPLSARQGVDRDIAAALAAGDIRKAATAYTALVARTGQPAPDALKAIANGAAAPLVRDRSLPVQLDEYVVAGSTVEPVHITVQLQEEPDGARMPLAHPVLHEFERIGMDIDDARACELIRVRFS